MDPELIFEPFPKLARLFRECVITEKIDGSNAQVAISDDLKTVQAGSRNRWLSPGRETDNLGFASWVEANREELLQLGPGRHFGEWWGQGIQRTYGLKEKRFSLFNHDRWFDAAVRPKCCHVVPLLHEGVFSEDTVKLVLTGLATNGSLAVDGWMKPEGIVVYHRASQKGFKVTLDGDGHKGVK